MEKIGDDEVAKIIAEGENPIQYELALKFKTYIAVTLNNGSFKISKMYFPNSRFPQSDFQTERLKTKKYDHLLKTPEESKNNFTEVQLFDFIASITQKRILKSTNVLVTIRARSTVPKVAPENLAENMETLSFESNLKEEEKK